MCKKCWYLFSLLVHQDQSLLNVNLSFELFLQLLFAKGSLVELLISSNIGRYTEFRSVTRVLTWINNRLQPVPCSRADVFATTDVSVVEKRMLMKLLTSFTQSDSSSEFEGKPVRLQIQLLSILFSYHSSNSFEPSEVRVDPPTNLKKIAARTGIFVQGLKLFRKMIFFKLG